jgi:hypothetical protein
MPTSSLGPSLRIPSTSPVERLAASQFHTYKMVVYYQIAGKKVGSHVVSLTELPARAAAHPPSLSLRADACET